MVDASSFFCFSGNKPICLPPFLPPPQPSTRAKPLRRLHCSPPGDSHSALTRLIKDDTKLLPNITLVSSTRLIAAARGRGSCRNRTLFTAPVTWQDLEVSWLRRKNAVEQGDGSVHAVTPALNKGKVWMEPGKQTGEQNLRERQPGSAARPGSMENGVFVWVKDSTSSITAISSKFSPRTTAWREDYQSH